MAGSNRIGMMRRHPVAAIAEKCATRLLRARHPTALAVTCDPEGCVELEPFDDAVPDDIVGVYDPDGFDAPRWLYLEKRISEDLRHHWQLIQQEVEAWGIRKSGLGRGSKLPRLDHADEC